MAHCVEMLFDECESITQVDQFFLDDDDSDELPMPEDMAGCTPTLKERLGALAAYLDDFESPIEFGHWESSPGTPPYFVMAGGAMDFVQTCYDFGWVKPFDWAEWMNSQEAVDLRDDPAALKRATPEQLIKLLTVIIRQSRFVEGALDSAFESSLLARIVRRASALAEERADELPLP